MKGKERQITAIKKTRQPLNCYKWPTILIVKTINPILSPYSSWRVRCLYAELVTFRAAESVSECCGGHGMEDQGFEEGAQVNGQDAR